MQRLNTCPSEYGNSLLNCWVHITCVGLPDKLEISAIPLSKYGVQS